VSKTILLIAGPTGVGKTGLALGLANGGAVGAGGGIISADSRQCYKELNIGVARPTAEELARVPHYFIANHSITEKVNAQTFAKEAQEAVEKIFRENGLALLVGGTGLYIQAFLEGLDDIPQIPEEIKENIRNAYERNGLEWLQKQVKAKDREWYEKGEIKNPHRLLRALEVVEATGASIRTFQQGSRMGTDYRVIKIGLELPREELYARIDTRVDTMMKNGLLKEVEGLEPHKNEKALDTVGYRELFDHLEGKESLETAVAKIKQHTRNYAKRQLTWFKRDPDIKWFSPEQLQEIRAFVSGAF